MPAAITETTEITGTLEAFHDAAVIAETLRVYNIKRAFCGQARLDFGTPTTDVFKNATNGAGKPLTDDVDFTTSARDELGMLAYLFLLRANIPATYVASKLVGSDTYRWVAPGTDDPLELPDSWFAIQPTLASLRNPQTWKTVMDTIVEAVNLLQEMSVSEKPRVEYGARTFTVRYLDYALESGPQKFQFVNGGEALAPQTVNRPVYSSATTSDEDTTAHPYGAGYGVTYNSGEGNPIRWSFSAAGFTSSEYFIKGWLPAFYPGGGNSTGEGNITRVILGVVKETFTVRLYVPASGTYTVTVQPNISLHFPDLSGVRTLTVTADGNTKTFPCNVPIDPFSDYLQFTKYITAPYADIVCTAELDGLDTTDFWESTVMADHDMTALVTVSPDAFNVLRIDDYSEIRARTTGSTAGFAFPAYVNSRYGVRSYSFAANADQPREAYVAGDGEQNAYPNTVTPWNGACADPSGALFNVSSSDYSFSLQRKVYRMRNYTAGALLVGVS